MSSDVGQVTRSPKEDRVSQNVLRHVLNLASCDDDDCSVFERVDEPLSPFVVLVGRDARRQFPGLEEVRVGRRQRLPIALDVARRRKMTLVACGMSEWSASSRRLEAEQATGRDVACARARSSLLDEVPDSWSGHRKSCLSDWKRSGQYRREEAVACQRSCSRLLSPHNKRLTYARAT